MFQEDSAGIQLYECTALNARITAKQCRINRKRASEASLFDERLNAGYLQPCLNCEGVLGEFKTKKRNKFKGKRRCANCRTHKDPGEFNRNSRTGELKVSCKKCEATQKKRKEKFKAPPVPPKICFSAGTQTVINGPAVNQFGLSDGYYRIIKRDDAYYLQSSEEKKDGFYTFTPKQQGLALHCAARAIMRNAGLTGSERFRIVEQAGKRLYRLEEENPAAG
jgi:hypothetical protein